LRIYLYSLGLMSVPDEVDRAQFFRHFPNIVSQYRIFSATLYSSKSRSQRTEF
jgi:hypothetical protein